MLAALDCREPDYVPCCFSAFSALSQKCTGRRDFLERQIDMGLDAAVQMPSLPVRHGPGVSTRTWLTEEPGEPALALEQAALQVLGAGVRRHEDLEADEPAVVFLERDHAPQLLENAGRLPGAGSSREQHATHRTRQGTALSRQRSRPPDTIARC